MTEEELIAFLEALELEGQFEMVHFEENAPILFLFDEHHGNQNECIDRNIRNAETLIEHTDVQLIGVESHAGGVEWDQHDKKYVTNDLNEKFYRQAVADYRSGCTAFVDGLAQHGGLIQGVESEGMIGKQHTQGETEGRNPLNELRSRHFIKTLGEEYITRGLEGNLILNCGSEHNNDIVRWINDESIEDIVGFKATYVRINTIDQ